MAKPIKYAEGYYCVLRPNGWKGKQVKRVFSWHKFPNPKQACQDYIDRTIGGRHSSPSASLEETIKEYLRNSRLLGRKRPSTIKTEEARFKKIIEWANANRVESVVQFDADCVRKFMLHFFSGGTWWERKQNRKVGDRKSTWMHYLMALSGLFKFCQARGMIRQNPAHNPEFRYRLVRQIPERIYSPEEITNVLQWIDDRYQNPAHSALFRILAYTGCRVSEALALTWNLVNLEQKVLILVKTKSGQPRAIPISDQLVPYLRDLKRVNELVIMPRVTGGRYYRIWRRALKDLGYRDGRLHDVRHSFATMFLLQTGQLRWVQEILGHASSGTTEIYTHVLSEHLQAGMKKLPY